MSRVPNPEAIRLHVVVAAAVTVGDAEAAERAMREIVEEARAAVMDMVTDSGPREH